MKKLMITENGQKMDWRSKQGWIAGVRALKEMRRKWEA